MRRIIVIFTVLCLASFQREEVENHVMVKDVGPGTHFFEVTKN